MKKERKDVAKKWSAYFLEFLMLFLAVSLSFFAENLRERKSDNAKEREYIFSMIEDAQKDKENISLAVTSNKLRIAHLDSLASFCSNYQPSLESDSILYSHYLHGLKHPDFVKPTERTLQQLKNAGGMRLIRNKKAVDHIVLYDNYTQKLANQQFYYERYQNSAIDTGVKLFNFQLFRFPNYGKEKRNKPFKLITRDKIKLQEFGNIISIYSGVAKYYGNILEEMDGQADSLIMTLRTEYKVKP